MAITDNLNLNAAQVAEQNPELHEMRQKFFGQEYLSDLEKGNTGTVQYYTGLGDPNAIDYTEAPIEESVVDTSTPVVDTGGGGGGGAGTITPDAGGNTAFEQNLLDQGIGVQAEPGAPISAPGEEMLLQQDIDDLAAYPLSSQSFAEGKATLEDAGGVPELGGVYATDYFPENNFLSDLDREALDTDLESMGGTYEPPIEQLNEPQEDIYQDRIMNIASQPMSQEELISSSADQGLEAFDPTLRDQIGNAFSSVKDKGVGGINILKDQLTALGGKVKEGFDNTIEIGGQTIDLGKSLLGGAISLVSGIPVVGTALSLAGDAFETSPEQKAMQSAALAAGIADPNDPRKDIYGINIVSAFGDYDQSVDDSIATLEESGANPEKLNKLKNYQNEKSKIDTATITTRDDAIDVGIAASDTDPADRGIQAANVDFSQERTDQNISQAIDDLAAQYDRSGKVDETITSDVSKAKDVIGMPQNLGDVGQGDPTGGRDAPAPTGTSGAPGGGDPGMRSAPSQSKSPGHPSNRGGGGQFGRRQEATASGGGGGNSGGGGKIVCTMMNDSYGFGSFRNKIWLRQSKNLAPEYQIGYHKIFLPLVKLSKKNIVLKKILEHIAIHRTIDIRQEARGKTHILGRIYRKVLEPICYWVGKNG